MQDILESWRNFQSEAAASAIALGSSTSHYLYGRGRSPPAKFGLPIRKWYGHYSGPFARLPLFDYRFVALSHNTMRGAAGGRY